jgi:hypothetical protein
VAFRCHTVVAVRSAAQCWQTVLIFAPQQTYIDIVASLDAFFLSVLIAAFVLNFDFADFACHLSRRTEDCSRCIRRIVHDHGFSHTPTVAVIPSTSLVPKAAFLVPRHNLTVQNDLFDRHVRVLQEYRINISDFL